MVDRISIQPNPFHKQLRSYLPVMTFTFHNRTYRYCNGNIFFDIAANYMNYDPSFISESITRIGVGAALSIAKDVALVKSYIMPSDPTQVDYYQGGLAASVIVKLLFDININNWAYRLPWCF